MDDNLLGFTDNSGGDPMAAVDAPEPPAMSGGYVDPFQGMPVKDSADDYSSAIPEVTALREWEDKHTQELEEKSRAEQAEKNQRKAAAEAEIAKWNEERKANVAKKSATNPEEEALGSANKSLPKGENAWERVVDLIDTNA